MRRDVEPDFPKDFLPIDPDTAFVAYWGHLVGYDAGYYGYAWADSIAADMATVFENAPNGFLDKSAGMKLRKEIYAPGGSRDIDVSIRKFLGRERSIQPYLKTLGIESPPKRAAGLPRKAIQVVRVSLRLNRRKSTDERLRRRQSFDSMRLP